MITSERNGFILAAFNKTGTTSIEKVLQRYNNRSTSGDYRRLYTDETRDIVAEWCRKDIEKFGYDF
jgi:hypothetical protein